MKSNYDVIVVTAHPDDAEIGIGGTMAKLAEENYNVLLVNLTDGEPTPLGSHEIRMKEAENSAKILGIDRYTLEDQCCVNRRLIDSFEARVALGDLFRKYKPKIVITMGGKTIMASPDHHQAQSITEAAVFYSRLSKWEEYFQYEVHSIKKLFYFPVSSFSTGDMPKNSFLIDISNTFDKKIASIKAYKSQFPPEKQGFIKRIEHSNLYLGGIINTKAAEVLMSSRLIKLETKDIFTL